MPILTDLRYSAKSFARTPSAAGALLLTIALGIGSNGAVQGFVRGLITRDLPLPGLDTAVSLFARDAERAAGPISYDDYVSLREHADLFAWLGAARESHGTILLDERSSLMSVAAVTPDLAALLQFSFTDGIVISHRVWQIEFGGKAEARGKVIRVDGAEVRVGGVAPDWLEGLYLGRTVDLWMPLAEASLQPIDRRSSSFWAVGRLRPGVSNTHVENTLNASRPSEHAITVLPYSGMTPEMADGFLRIGTLLGTAAGAVFFIACANVASFLLARASTRARETSVRVALGAGRGQLTRQLLSDSVLITVAGGALGMLLAIWTMQIVPALFFESEADELRFVPDLVRIGAASAACAAITIACGLVPLIEMRHDDPAAVLRRESAGPSRAMRRVRAGLVVAQMACCCLLVISTGLLYQGFRTALQTHVGHRLGEPILATVRVRPGGATRSEGVARGLEYFRAIEEAGQTVLGVSRTTWAGRLPGSRPSWQTLRIEPAQLPFRDVELDVAAFTPQALTIIKLPPLAGRMFGWQDTPNGCKAVVVNEHAATEVFDGDAVGRALVDPTGHRVEIVGVVAMREPEDKTVQPRRTIFYYATQGGTPLERVGPARFGVPIDESPTRAVLDANVVAPNYFDAMDLSPAAGRLFTSADAPGGCRVAVINQEAAERYFNGGGVGATVIDRAGIRTGIIGIVQSPPLRTFQRRVEPAIYYPMTQDFIPRMTLILGTRQSSDRMLDDVRRKLDAVPGGYHAAVVTTLDTHLERNALAPMRIATVLVGASAVIALTLGVLGLYGAMTDAAHQRRREIAVRIALGAQGWGVIRQVLGEGVRLAGVGTMTGMLGSVVVAGWLARITPTAGAVAAWVWLAAPLVLVAAVAVASVLPARRALAVDPLTIMRDDT